MISFISDFHIAGTTKRDIRKIIKQIKKCNRKNFIIGGGGISAKSHKTDSADEVLRKVVEQ